MRITVLISAMFLLIASCTNKNNSANKDDYMLKINLQSEKLKNKLLQVAIISTVKISNKYISDSQKIVDENRDTIALKDYVAESKSLILYTGSKFCSSCFKDELSALSFFASKNKKLKTLVLVENLSIRDLIIEKKRNDYKFNIGIIPNSTFSNDYLDGKGYPLYFLLNGRLEIQHPYISYKQMHQLTIKYLNTIAQNN